jgi:hypothetical protein
MVAAILGGLVVVATDITTILGAADKIGEALGKACRAVHLCAIPAPETPAIPDYVTEWVDGGHNWAEFCASEAEGDAG